MSDRFRPWKENNKRVRNFEAKRMIEEGTGRGRPFRDRRDRRAKERSSMRNLLKDDFEN